MTIPPALLNSPPVLLQMSLPPLQLSKAALLLKASKVPVILWFRRDLRLTDNAAVTAAIETGRPVIPVFILDEDTPGAWAPGAATLWWLHHSLAALDADLRSRGSQLILRHGPYARELPRLIAETGANEVHVGLPTEPWARRSIEHLSLSIPIKRHRTALMFHPDVIRTGAGTPYSVFTPFSRACLRSYQPRPPLRAPDKFPPTPMPQSAVLDEWELQPKMPDWSGGLNGSHTPGEAGALACLKAFLPKTADYDGARNLPGTPGTSRLSPHLAWGEISPDIVWSAVSQQGQTPGLFVFKNELLWREFSAYLLWHSPTLPDEPLKKIYAAFPWRTDAKALRSWQTGQTGVPIVDAGMRELWATGWMHNRVRMITASFLIKHLLIDWREGENWFWHTLVDADLAANAASWQWVAGSGADASPFFRIFNPVLQGEKFDPAGHYVRKWVPELSEMPNKYIHAPWSAPVVLQNYPAPIINLAFGRTRALDALKLVTKSG